MKKLILCLCLLAFFTACEQSAQSEETNTEEVSANDTQTAEVNEEEAEEGAELPPVDAVGNFGAEVSAEGALSGAEVLDNLGDADSAHIKVRGTISSCCQAKGCWMTMPIGDEKEMMVKFKDYAFFVPRNSTGKEAVIEGWVYREMVSVEELQHLASDANAPQEEIDAITEPEERVTFMADGVLVEASAEGAQE